MATDARLKLRRNSIQIRAPENNKLELYTSRFWRKISAKGSTTSASTFRSTEKRSKDMDDKDDVTVSVGDVIRGIRKRQVKTNNHSSLSGPGKRKFRNKIVPDASALPGHASTSKGLTKNIKNNTKVNINNKKAKVRRESTFTGKSLLVSTTNDLFSQKKKKNAKELAKRLDDRKIKKIPALSRATRRLQNQNMRKFPAVDGVTSERIQKTIEFDNVTCEGSSPEKKFSPSTTPPPLRDSIPARLVISNLHPNVTQDDVMELFGALGPLRDGRLISPRSAEVIYAVSDDAFTAYEKYHGRNLDGQPMLLTITSVEQTSDGFSSRSSSRSPPCDSSKPVMFTVKL